MLLMVILVASPMITNYQNKLNFSFRRHQADILKRLNYSKEQLIALAVSYADNYKPSGAGPGHLPCPNQEVPDGRRAHDGPSPPCGGGVISLGRLPRLSTISAGGKVLNYQPGAYDANSSFWYAVSRRFINNPFTATSIINPASEGDLLLDTQSGYIAIVAYAGASLTQQAKNRHSSRAIDYLELENADGDLEFSNLQGTEANDVLVGIRIEELMPLLTERVLVYLASWLQAYKLVHCSGENNMLCYPMAAEFSDGQCADETQNGWLAVNLGDCEDTLFAATLFEGVKTGSHWFIRNKWASHIRYQVSKDCQINADLDCEVITGESEIAGVKYPTVFVVGADQPAKF